MVRQKRREWKDINLKIDVPENKCNQSQMLAWNDIKPPQRTQRDKRVTLDA